MDEEKGEVAPATDNEYDEFEHDGGEEVENGEEEENLPELTSTQIQQFREAYSIFDKDGDGGITTEELGSVMKALGHKATKEEVEQMFAQVDDDGSGEIEFDEFLVIMQRQMKLANLNGNAASGENWYEAFKIFDRNGDGYIDSEELGRVLRNMGENLQQFEIDEMIKEVDKTGDGKVNYDEFVHVMIHGIPDV